MINEHWNKIFKKTESENLGWFEKDFNQTLKFLKLVENLSEKDVFVAGAGTSMLVEKLIGKCQNLFLNDISDEALSILKQRIGRVKQGIIYLNADIGSELPIENESIDVWIDRAVLHFLLDEDQIDAYFKNLIDKIKVNGYAFLAEFASHGAPKCAGLKLHRYSIEELSERCGRNFNLVRSESYTYINPEGDERPYIYCLFKKIA